MTTRATYLFILVLSTFLLAEQYNSVTVCIAALSNQIKEKSHILFHERACKIMVYYGFNEFTTIVIYILVITHKTLIKECKAIDKIFSNVCR